MTALGINIRPPKLRELGSAREVLLWMASQNIHFLTGNLLEDVAASKFLPSPAIGVSVACLDNGALCRLR